jgi:hypothetical protein
VSLLQANLPELMHNMFVRDLPEAAIHRAVYNRGAITLENKILEIDKVLFDSGALHGSYISESYVKKYKHYFSNYLIDEPKRLILADGDKAIET